MKIKSVKRLFYKGVENQGKVEKGEYTGSQETLYNEQGNLLKETFYHPDQTIEEIKDRLYDAHGRLVEENIYKEDVYKENAAYYKENEEPTHNKATYLYDAHGQLIEECRYFYRKENIGGKTIFNKDKFSKSLSIYDTNGNLLVKYKKSAFDSEEGFDSKEIYTYDDKGNEIQSNWYWREKLQATTTYLYDEKGNLSQSKWHSTNGELSLSSYSYAYNPETQLTEITTFSNGDKFEIIHKDSEGNVVMVSHFYLLQEPKGILSDKKTIQKDFEEFCTYDDNGNLHKKHIKRYDNKGYCIEYKCFVYERYSVKESDEIPTGYLLESDVCQNTYDENENLIHQTRCMEYFYQEPIKVIIITEFIREYY